MGNKEIWKPIKGYKGYYEVSNLGNVRSIDRTIKDKNGKAKIIKGVLLKQAKDKFGYCRVSLSKNGNVEKRTVHRLVAESYINNPEEKETVNHKDENPSNNCVDNLEWLSQNDNLNYGTRRIREAQTKGKEIVQLTLDGEYVNLFHSIREAGRQINNNYGGIRDVLMGSYYQAYGYCWVYKEEYERYFR